MNPKSVPHNRVEMTKNKTLEDVLKEHAVEGVLYEKLEDGKVRCFACGHFCTIPEGKPGICKIRYNEKGTLFVPRGYVGALQCDPIEKKPFFHVLPGALAFSFGMLGCDFRCSYCQNWVTSQALRDPVAGASPMLVSPQEMVALAKKYNAKVMTSTYNEPLITSEWAIEIFKEAKKAGLRCSYVSNGNGTPQVLDYIRPYVDFYKVDLKSFNSLNYLHLGGKLDNILKTIGLLKEKGFWVEIVTLTIPGFNDSNEELTSIAKFIAGTDPNTPWHVTAFHQDYHMTDPDNTPIETLIRGCEIGRNAGLKFCYAGNIPGKVGDWENTRCPSCNDLLIERFGFTVLQNNIKKSHCPKCQTVIPGIWE
jgi:pyruvate formate lyase activating enzyme